MFVLFSFLGALMRIKAFKHLPKNIWVSIVGFFQRKSQKLSVPTRGVGESVQITGARRSEGDPVILLLVNCTN